MFSQTSLRAFLAITPFIGAVSACVGPPVNVATLDLIKEFEGFVESPAPDPIDLPTVGYGHLCDEPNCAEVPYPFPLTEETATQLLLSDVIEFQDLITNVLADPVVLNENQYGALVSWAFNVGPSNVETSSLVDRLNALEDPNIVNAEELPLWIYAGGEVMPGLIRRRDAEVALSSTPTDIGAIPVPC